MSALWLPILIGFVGVAIFEAVGYLNRGSAASLADPPQRRVLPARSQRVQYWSLCIAFVIAPLVAVWIGVWIAPTRTWGAALLITAGLWLLLGLFPAIISAVQGRAAFQAFKTSVEYQSRGSFKSLVRLWILAIGMAALIALRRLSS
jgi:hypothetical protein